MADTDRITTHTLSGTVRVCWHDRVIAETHEAVELAERGYPDRLYVPMADVATEALSVSKKTTHCPFKGDATYYHLVADGDRLDDAAWCYDEPIADVAEIAGHVAFDHEALAIERPD